MTDYGEDGRHKQRMSKWAAQRKINRYFFFFFFFFLGVDTANPKGPIGLGNTETEFQQMQESIRNLQEELGTERQARLMLEERYQQLEEKVVLLQMSNNQLCHEHARLFQRFEGQ